MQVRKRPLNKKEIAKKEEDIITIEPHSNSVTVHETKLKVRTPSDHFVTVLSTFGATFYRSLNPEVTCIDFCQNLFFYRCLVLLCLD